MTWFIKPISKSYFGKSNVSVREIALKRRAGTIVIADRLNPDNTTTRVLLVPEGFSPKVKDGALYEVRNSTNDRKYGEHFVLAVVTFCFKHGILQLGNIPVATAEYSEVVDTEGAVFEFVRS